jgi:hypothetical protein
LNPFSATHHAAPSAHGTATASAAAAAALRAVLDAAAVESVCPPSDVAEGAVLPPPGGAAPLGTGSGMARARTPFFFSLFFRFSEPLLTEATASCARQAERERKKIDTKMGPEKPPATLAEQFLAGQAEISDRLARETEGGRCGI